jgi:multidrug efflux system membrane fusion protein
MRSKIEGQSNQIFAWLLLAGLSILTCSLLQGCNNAQSARASKKADMMRGGGAVPVTVTKVIQKDVPIDIQVVGNVEAYLTITVKSQVNGEITQAFFKEGDFVKKRDQLFTIDQRTYQAQVNQAQANLAKDQAALAQIEANLARDQAQQKYAQSEAARYTSLYARQLVAKEQTEQMASNADAAAAAVRADMAAIQSAQATVEATKASLENAKVMLEYTVIRSPLDGRTGNMDVKQGNVIMSNTSLTTINQVEPIYVTFSVPEAQLKSISKGQSVMVSTDNDTDPPRIGKLTFIDNTVDSSTGTIRLKATFPNSDRKLWPGEFVHVTLRLQIQPNALVVPNQAVQTGQDGTYVFVVKEDRTVESRPVVAGTRVGEDQVIEKGLQLGETVVTEGQLRLAPGSRVQLASEFRPGQGGQRGGGGGGTRGGFGRPGGGRGQVLGGEMP